MSAPTANEASRTCSAPCRSGSSSSGAAVGCLSTFVLGHELWVLAFPCLLGLALLLGLRLAFEPRLLIVALVVIFGGQLLADQVQTLDQRRTFFGSYRVTEVDGLHSLVHGTTVHGSQFLDDGQPSRRRYYVRNGPLGDDLRRRAVLRRGRHRSRRRRRSRPTANQAWT